MRVTIALLLTVAASLSAATWSPLGTWQGTGGAKETETFTTTQKEWRVRWTATPTASPRLFSVTVRAADTRDVVSIISAGEEPSGESYVRGPAGKYYVSIATVNAKWTLVAEESR